MMQRGDHLPEDIPALGLLHIRPHLNIIEEVHPWKSMRDHLDVIIDVVLEEVRHLYDIGMPEVVPSKIVKDVDL